jgi:MFS family permease
LVRIACQIGTLGRNSASEWLDVKQEREADRKVAAWSMLAWLCLGVGGSLSTWFSATAVAPEMIEALHLGSGATSWLTNGVQIGFVCGALLASIFNLPDIVRMNRLAAGSAVLAGICNAGLLLGPDLALATLCRFLTGFALAGVYPPAMKLTATWFRKSRGLALGIVIGALTAGSALPHLFRALTTTLNWQTVVQLSSLASLTSAIIFAAIIQEGPFPFSRTVFNPRQIGHIFRSRPLMLVNAGYLGHMWELYAMWAWLLTFLRNATAMLAGAGSLMTFIALLSGVIGCLIGGLLSDRFGRATSAIIMMMLSGLCAIVIGFVADGPFWLLAAVVVLWGITVIGDSAQFSAAAAETAEPHLVGTALSLQMGLGFALTSISIWLLPLMAQWTGWRWAFVMLAPGPLLGVWAMLMFKRHAKRPE